ncbi:SRPBCC domain-containing protein [Rhizobium laguerreae]|uniref:SRPBCC family protein n=1 Tax=Rhizobium laguerreae TaxID=1076926 RepID=UPI001C91F6E6|nr:SRPBCC domain-containing protein [Rhizobium laguerreae]MBY3257416.1 SRPBCC domain-containing protein [Rhizobium laguerreae]MBY3285622.1 SRPBCC domain-containing protein [Rhizobium laguerreae]MBY3292286.1 SRPBCC domain-containing protein [Rhizobium laguerreae]MBY3462792.1 SRPBCC domain-containing protein [Rhizobium laguerreae]
MTNLETDTDNTRDLVLVRRFDAPCDLVFRAWTDPKALAQWCGPHGFKAVGDRLEAWPGGRHRACLIAPDGEEHWVGGQYLEVEPPHRLVFTHAWESTTGENSPETVVTITFRDSDGGTEMTFRQSGFDSASSLEGHEDGWAQSFERLSLFLGTESEGSDHA